jgi:hypothetical protein
MDPSASAPKPRLAQLLPGLFAEWMLATVAFAALLSSELEPSLKTAVTAAFLLVLYIAEEQLEASAWHRQISDAVAVATLGVLDQRENERAGLVAKETLGDIEELRRQIDDPRGHRVTGVQMRLGRYGVWLASGYLVHLLVIAYQAQAA